MNQTLKCRRIIYDLVDGDTVLDNGSCIQLTTRRIIKGFYTTVPIVSKKEFERYKAMPEVNKVEPELPGNKMVFWRFTKKDK